MMGKGSVNHNTRAFSAKNVDKARSSDNVSFCHTDIKQVYHELFDEALERYNAKQKRSDRRIDDYYEKIRQGKQEKLFYEAIFQIGNKDDSSVRSVDGQLAAKILCEFMDDFQRRNPNLYVFSAHLHMDEETPHLHIDFVPFTRNSKRGLDTRVSLKSALADQGFRGGKRGSTEWNEWMESEKQELAKVMERYGVHWKQQGTHNKHLSVLDFEKQERTKEVAELDRQIETSEATLKAVTKLTDDQFEQNKRLRESGKQLEQQNDELQAEKVELERTNSETAQSNQALTEQNLSLIIQNEDLKGERERLESGNQELEKKNEKLKKELKSKEGIKSTLERNVRAYDEDKEWQLPEPGIFTTAKSYFENIAQPLVEKLKKCIKSLTIKYINLLSDFKELTAWSERQSAQLVFCREKIEKQEALIDRLQEKADDLERVKRYSGEETIQDIIDKTRAIDRQLEARREAERQAKRSINRGLIR
jgi:hypothetical protein